MTTLEELQKEYKDKKELIRFKPLGSDLPTKEIREKYVEMRKTLTNDEILNILAEEYNISYYKVRAILLGHWYMGPGVFINQTKEERSKKQAIQRERMGPIELELKDRLNSKILQMLGLNWLSELDCMALSVHNLTKLHNAIKSE